MMTCQSRLIPILLFQEVSESNHKELVRAWVPCRPLPPFPSQPKKQQKGGNENNLVSVYYFTSKIFTRKIPAKKFLPKMHNIWKLFNAKNISAIYYTYITMRLKFLKPKKFPKIMVQLF